MPCAERNWALIRHAGSAPEASIGSKPLGSELAYIGASLAPKCQEFLDGPGSYSRLGAWDAARCCSSQGIDIIDVFLGQRPELADPGRQGARR